VVVVVGAQGNLWCRVGYLERCSRIVKWLRVRLADWTGGGIGTERGDAVKWCDDDEEDWELEASRALTSVTGSALAGADVAWVIGGAVVVAQSRGTRDQTCGGVVTILTIIMPA